MRVECAAFSIPAPERVLWTFNGHEVNAQDQDYSVLEDPLPEGVKSTLIIRESQERHYGVYNCSVTNPYGSDVAEISLMAQSECQEVNTRIFLLFGFPSTHRKFPPVDRRYWSCGHHHRHTDPHFNHLPAQQTKQQKDPTRR